MSLRCFSVISTVTSWGTENDGQVISYHKVELYTNISFTTATTSTFPVMSEAFVSSQTLNFWWLTTESVQTTNAFPTHGYNLANSNKTSVCVWSELYEHNDASTNLQTYTAQSTKIKRLPGCAVQLWVRVTEIDGERKTDKERGSPRDRPSAEQRWASLLKNGTSVRLNPCMHSSAKVFSWYKERLCAWKEI